MSQDTVEVPGINLDRNGALIITATPTSSKHDFDFCEGKWKIRNKQLKSIFTGCTEWSEFSSTQETYRMLNGLGNIDKYLAEFDAKPFEGMTLRLFNTETNLWSIYWAHSNRGTLDPPLVGSFEKNIGYFYTRDAHKNKKIITVFRWDTTDKNNPLWSRAFSPDNGQSWEWNWFMYFSRIH
jgi:hypothetical protein